MSTGKVFLNYRRDDTRYIARALHDRLKAEFGPENVFFDVGGESGIPPGVKYRPYLYNQVAACDMMLTLIGPDWLTLLAERQASGAPDFVQIEIEAALDREIPLVPVLADGANMPSATELPGSLSELREHHAALLRFEQFDSDVATLVAGVRRTFALTNPTARPSVSFPVPEMIRIAPGSFLMGSDPGEVGAFEAEQPKHRVRIDYGFEIGKYAVAFDEYDAFCEETGRDKPGDEGWGRGRRPVINVNVADAEAYCAWLSRELGFNEDAAFRLPSEAEWEYCCRAGTSGPFSFDGPISTDLANYDGNYTFEGSRKGAYRRQTVEVGSLPANPWGLHEVHGNVWEWCADCWNDSYRGAPPDGAAWKSGDCSIAVLRGGSWYGVPQSLRSALRDRVTRDGRDIFIGFRVARTHSGD